MLKLLMLAEVGMLARDHLSRLKPQEQRQLFTLVRKGRGRHTRNLTDSERSELARLVAKLEPRAFAALAADRMSPVPLPTKLLGGRKR
jgi:hypothetical protein